MSLGLIREFIYQTAWIDQAVTAVAISIAIYLGALFCFYLIGNLFAGIHIFRVRVLRQDLTSHSDNDIWPYLKCEDLEQDKRAIGSDLSQLQDDF